MAETVVSFVVGKLGNLLIEEAVWLHGIPDEVEWVQRELKRMQCFLKDAEAKRRKGDERVQNWVCEVRDVAYQVEDVIDTVKHTIEKRHQRNGGIFSAISRYAHYPEELATRREVGLEIERIKVKIREIAESRATYGIANLGESGDEGISNVDEVLQARRRIYPHLDDDKDVVCTVEDAKKMLMEQLLDMNNPRRCVISIVGMGGAGKTTLASRIYNSPDIKRHFNKLAWVSVSQDYRIIGLLKDILEKVTGIRTDEGDEYVREKIHESLKGVRYLIVLDDVWTTNVWDQIRNVFPNNNDGSRVMLTTRNIDVAKSADPITPPHVLRLLNDEESWELFCKKAFPGNQEDQIRCPQELEDLSRQLSRRCCGLPLALVVLGGLMSRKEQAYPVWLDVAESMIWESTTDGQQCLDVLALSYNDLPHHYLKSCFIYIGSFPEDTSISTSTLIRLWIAEGFIPQRPHQTFEETARGYLDELVQRCMVQVAKRSLAHGWTKRIRIHDLLRDLCISEARKDGSLNVCESPIDSCVMTVATRRVALFNIMLDGFTKSIPNLHTLLVFGAQNSNRSTGKLNRLRVLHAEDELPLKIFTKCKNIHLRYLKLRCKSLSSSIENLCNLITLDTKGLEYEVPDTIWKIETLRHVYFRDCPIRPPATFRLPNLQVLWLVLAGQWIGRSLANHTNLRKLGISDILISHHKDLTISLQKLDRLHTLRLESSESIPIDVLKVFRNQYHLHSLILYGKLSNRQQLPPSSEFPPKLVKLVLDGCKLEDDLMPTLEKLPNLVRLHLRNAYEGKSMFCSVGGFSRLQTLMLGSLNYLSDWRVEGGAMPSLTTLTIYQCKCLKIIPEGFKHLTSLQKLALIHMPKEVKGRVQEDCGEDWYKIRHVPSIIT